MTAQSTDPATAPFGGSRIADLLPAMQWAGELLHHCIRSHEDRVRELRASRPGYDPQAAQRAIAAAYASLDNFLEVTGLVGTKRDLVLSYWDRGLQADAVEAVRLGFAEKIRTVPDNWNGLVGIFQHFASDPQYQSESGTSLYGGAALCLHIASLAGRDPHDLIVDVAAPREIAAGSTKQPAAASKRQAKPTSSSRPK